MVGLGLVGRDFAGGAGGRLGVPHELIDFSNQ